jgi:hypothetical protein
VKRRFLCASHSRVCGVPCGDKLPRTAWTRRSRETAASIRLKKPQHVCAGMTFTQVGQHFTGRAIHRREHIDGAVAPTVMVTPLPDRVSSAATAGCGPTLGTASARRSRTPPPGAADVIRCDSVRFCLLTRLQRQSWRAHYKSPHYPHQNASDQSSGSFQPDGGLANYTSSSWPTVGS